MSLEGSFYFRFLWEKKLSREEEPVRRSFDEKPVRGHIRAARES
jgi:hypothetical protein